MTTTNQAELFDFSFRPESYWANENPVDAIVSDIKGEQRKRLVREALEEGKVGDLPDSVIASRLEEPERREWGRIHPLFMGGEYLADDLPGEAAIARVSLNSTTGNVSELRARPWNGGLAYRVVDEYETPSVLPFDWSRKPLAAWQVVRLLDECHGLCIHMGTGIVLAPVAMNYGRGPRTRDEIEEWKSRTTRFATVDSRFYPGLGDWYRRRIARWADGVIAAKGMTTADAEGGA